MKGAPPDIQDNVYKTFIEDCHARYSVTSAKHDKKKLNEDGLKRRGIVGGKHSKCSSTMQLDIYSKGIGNNKSPLLNKLFPLVSSLQVRSAFEFFGKFHNTPKDRKKELMKELIKRVNQVKLF